MQDIVENKESGDEMHAEISQRKVVVEEPLTKEKTSGAPTFPSIETSPIFEKMKRHNKDRESFSDEFVADEKSNSRRLFVKIAIILGAVLFLGAFLYGLFFYNAVLTIVLKHVDVVLQSQEFLAGGAGAEAFQTMALSGGGSTDLAATGEKNVVSKSSGKIIIYNNFGAQTQALIKNTRFQSSDGKVYRIRDSIVVPGQKTVNGKQVPGSLEVVAYADAAGAEYNIGLADFTIPGFKGSPKYAKFYARGKTPMTGGFSGLMKVVSPADIQKAKDALASELKDKLFAQAVAQKPKGTILYKDAVFYSFADSIDADATAKSASDKTVKLTVKGSLTAVLFNAEDLSKRIVKASVAPTDASNTLLANDRILVTNIEELEFVPKNAAGTPPKEGDTYAFALKGTAHAIWQVDTATLQGKLVGVKKADYKNVLAEFSGIEKATAHIRPFWKTKFPSDIAKIRVEVTPN